MEVKKTMTEYKMFEGCTIGNRIPFIEAASRKVFEKLGIETSQAPFSCCPDPTGMKSFDDESWLALGARNLCLAESEGKSIISLCNGCANTLRGVQHQLKHDDIKKKRVNQILSKVGKEYKGSIDVVHFVDAIKQIGAEKIKSAITKDLSGLKVAVHPGCHYMRPAEWMESDDPMRPTTLKELVKASGATLVEYEEEVLCCGSAVSNAYEEIGMQNLKRKLDSVNKAGADVICVNCPACFQQFDTQQRPLSKEFDGNYDVPVLYLTELLALGMGIDPDEIGLKYHRTRLKSTLQKLGL
ncbi:MAG: CoB--CoM heterodisulfide reductase subunit B [Candidatus Lokiarchaeota archaeon]|nr:CoB--CoM heterodisulfide reductase subunit B [Candidatus Lokiarchaeota archaeon]MBD3339332.1 CoB--CoM heterodisulfide reductase subunit B [Candidatus Lokiarchaeota archaeon]